MTDLALAGRVVVWGHSQGGNSALWTGIIAARYAPDVNVAGVAALAPATDLGSLVATAKASTFGKIVSAFLVHAYAARYPDVRSEDYLAGRALPVVRDIVSRCVGGWETLLSALETTLLPSDGIFLRDPRDGPLSERLRESTPRQPIPMPLLLAQGDRDDLVSPAVQLSFVKERCATGQKIDYQVYPGLDHLSLVGAGSPLERALVLWTQDRFAGKPAASSCPT